MLLKFFGSIKEMRIYYGNDFIFSFLVKFNEKTKRLYIAKIKSMNSYIFKNIDIKYKMYVKIIIKILFNNVIIKDFFDYIFIYAIIL